MPALDFSLGHLAVVLLLTAGLAVSYVTLGWLHDLNRVRRYRILTRSYQHLAAVLFGSYAAAARASGHLSRVPRHMLLDLMQRLSWDLGGDVNRRLRHLAVTTGLVRTIRTRARSRRWTSRAQGAALLSLLPDKDALRSALLTDHHPIVRARAAESVDSEEIADCVDHLMGLLDDPVEFVRFSAQQSLLRGDARIVPALAHHLSKAEGPGTVWALEIAAHLPDPRLIPLIRRHLESPDPRLRSVATEAIIPWLEDPFILRGLLRDPDAGVRATAARAAGMTSAEIVAEDVGRLLSDAVWDVRHQAGLALATMGPTGRMTLRIHLRDPDPYARDMAALMFDTLAAQDGVSRFRLGTVGPTGEGRAA